jgi:NADP-reducing hydrogenase subunit HndC
MKVWNYASRNYIEWIKYKNTSVSRGQGTMQDLEEMEELCHYIKDNSLCGLGQTAPNPVLSTLQYFKDEYIEHVVNKRCPAGVCKDLMQYFITDKCTGCTICAKKCPVNAISGTVRSLHTIDQTKCTKCGICYDVCKFKAIIKK